MLEAATTLGFLAARTERVRLGTMVTYRPPAVLVKAITTLDVLSGGRAWLGVGSGYSEQESRAMDVPLPPVAERFERLDETLRLVARYGDACNLFDVPDGGKMLRHKLNVLAEHCADEGRDFAGIDKTVSTRLDDGDSKDDFVRRCRELAELGADHVVAITAGPWDEKKVATLAAAAGELR